MSRFANCILTNIIHDRLNFTVKLPVSFSFNQEHECKPMDKIEICRDSLKQNKTKLDWIS